MVFFKGSSSVEVVYSTGQVPVPLYMEQVGYVGDVAVEVVRCTKLFSGLALQVRTAGRVNGEHSAIEEFVIIPSPDKTYTSETEAIKEATALLKEIVDEE